MKKESKPTAELPTAQPVKVVESPQQQQMKFYVAARRDLNSGKNQISACNNAQRAYNYGKLQGTEGTRVYTESGMLVARCLTSVPSYSNRFSNSKAQATRVLQNLAVNYNHSGAKICCGRSSNLTACMLDFKNLSNQWDDPNDWTGDDI